MKITLVGSGEELLALQEKVNASLLKLQASSLVEVVSHNDPAYKMELGITQNPALCIEEDSIEFRDLIFEGVIPEMDEIEGMFVSLLGSEVASSCSTG